MGCFGSKHDEEKGELVLECVDESRNTETKLDFIQETESIAISNEGCLPKHSCNYHGVKSGVKWEGRGTTCITLDMLGITSATSDDVIAAGDEVMTRRMKLLRDVAELQMVQLRLHREKYHRSIIYRDSMIVIDALKEMKLACDHGDEECEDGDNGESMGKDAGLGEEMIIDDSQSPLEDDLERERRGLGNASDTSDDVIAVDDVTMARRMKLLKDVAELQMDQLRLYRENYHRGIIYRDSMIVIREMKLACDDECEETMGEDAGLEEEMIIDDTQGHLEDDVEWEGRGLDNASDASDGVTAVDDVTMARRMKLLKVHLNFKLIS